MGFVRQYIWTPALTEMLRQAYTMPRAERSVALNAIQRTSGFPRHVLIDEARRLGLNREHKTWTRGEDLVVSTAVGDQDIARIAQKLGRTREAVRMRAKRLGISTRVRADYSVGDLMQIFGEGRRRVADWIDRGLLGRPMQTNTGTRVKDGAVVTFIQRHSDIYSLRRADETFLKGVLCGDREGLSGEAVTSPSRRGQETEDGPRRSPGAGGLQIAS